MIRYESLIEGIRHRARLGEDPDAGAVAAVVLNALAQTLPPPLRKQLAGQLPGSLDQTVDVATPIQDVPAATVMKAIADRLGVDGARAEFLAYAVVDELRTQDAALVDEVFGQLPDDVASAVRDIGMPPDRAVSVDPGMPLRLGPDDVATRLRALPDWSGDEHHIERTIEVPVEWAEPISRRAERVAHRANDHVHVERQGGSVRFVLRTAGNYVSEPDFEVAQQIDQIIAEFG
jgi:uncharacterized protein (DUF2267 family)/pterin-4a-carbinolamine dehydratase